MLPAKSDILEMRDHVRIDVVAGLSVAVVALPLALAFGVASGAGAAAGMATAIVAGILAALFGGSRLQVSGPTGAMTVVLIPLSAKYGVDAVLAVGFLAGLILLVMAVTGLARTMRYLPVTVIEGFTIGIALLIGLQQVPYALGQATNSEHSSVVTTAIAALANWRTNPTWPALFLAGASAATILVVGRFKPKFPTALIAVLLATLTTVAMDWQVMQVGEMPPGLVWIGLPNFSALPALALFIAALSVAGLAALESLLSATVADNLAKMPHHKPNQEVFGQGIANLVTPLFGGVPATAAIARTAVNVRNGARTRLAAITHSVALLLFMLVGANYVSLIPLASLAGVLIATSIRMIDFEKIREFNQAAKTDFGVVAVTAICTLLLDLMQAVLIGIVVAGALNFLQGKRAQAANEAQVRALEDLLEEHNK